jgi:LysR family nitrogen assimilation transcriptional regulator
MATSNLANKQLSFGARAFRYFVSVAELGSVSRASAILGISQPALSRQLSQLESQLGFALLVRHFRGVRLTTSGERFYQEVLSLQRHFSQVCAEIADERDVPQGTVVLAITPTAAEAILPDLIVQYRARCPRVKIAIRQGYSDQVEHMLEGGHADLAVFPVYREFGSVSPQLVTKPVLKERQVLIGPRSAKMPGSYTLKEIARLPLILPGRNNGLRLVVERLASERGLELQIVAEIEGMDMLRALVAKGVGYSILPDHTVLGAHQKKLFKVAQITSPQLVRTLSVAWSGSRVLSQAATQMASLIFSIAETSFPRSKSSRFVKPEIRDRGRDGIASADLVHKAEPANQSNRRS